MSFFLGMDNWFDHSEALLSDLDGEPQPGNSEVKKHAACDECRKRKLKCSSEQGGCDRCRRQSIKCYYSIQKPMGRPRKKRERSYDGIEAQPSTTQVWPGEGPMPSVDSVMPNPDIQPQGHGSFKNQNYPAEFNQFMAGGPVDGLRERELQPSPLAGLPTPPNIWPYLPTPPPRAQSQQPSNTTTAADGIYTNSSSSYGSPQCTCLSYIYLSLSTLSALPPFPTSPDTLISLHAAARTARAAIQCPECPLRFATSMQNVMLLGTLFNVIGDGWLRASRSNSRELGINCAPESYAATMPEDPDKQQEFWKHWHRQVIRRGVLGGHIDPAMYTPDLRCEETLDLISLIIEMEQRQNMWHELGIANFSGKGEMKCEPLHANGGHGHSTSKQVEERDFLCLRVVGSARDLLEKFDFQPEDHMA